jgi:hypothetical protein
MNNKVIDKKMINKVARKVGVSRGRKARSLMDQYAIIREDMKRLRNDILKGYGMTKAWFGKRGSVRKIIIKTK